MFLSSLCYGDTNWSIKERLPHHPGAFTQGLNFVDGKLYETTGQYGQSSLLIYQPGELPEHALTQLPPQFFGEGSVVIDDEVIWLTWKSGMAISYNLVSMQAKIAFHYQGEGWGLAINEKKSRLAMSDGTNRIKILDINGSPINSLQVTGLGRKWSNLNELEWVGNTLFAFVWLKDELIAIDDKTGEVKAYYNLKALREQQSSRQTIDRNAAINGLAYDNSNKEFYITGKYWDSLYKIELKGWQ